MKQIPGGKRKLSKRKDPEASVDLYIAAGYPAEAVLYYLRGLANGRLAELPLPEALAAPIGVGHHEGVGHQAGRRHRTGSAVLHVNGVAWDPCEERPASRSRLARAPRGQL